MGVGRGLNVGNLLETPFFLLGNLSLMRSFELGQHLVKSNREAPDLVLALVIDAVAVILGPVHRPCEPFEPRQRPHDVVMRQKSEEDTSERQRAGQPKAAMQLAEQIVDALIEKAFQFRLADRPSRDRIVHGRLVSVIAELQVQPARRRYRSGHGSMNQCWTAFA